MRWRTLLLLALLLLFSTGGSFTCFYHSGDDHDHPPTPRP